MVFFTVVIPVKRINNYVIENIQAIQRQSYQNWELIVVTDFEEFRDWSDSRIMTVSSGEVSPAIKRDLAARFARGEYLVFLDDDSYIENNYFKNALELIADSDVKVFGGPAITPSDDSVWQKTSGACYELRLLSSSPSRYRPIGKIRKVLDWPSVNLIVYKPIFQSVGGFGNEYWPGEDSKFCEKLNSQNISIWYSPDLIVYHHRRRSLRAHLKQSSNYGKHRGRFARDGDVNSTSLLFAIPFIFLFYCVLITVLFLLEVKSGVLYVPLFLYFVALFSSALNTYFRWGLIVSFLVILYLPLTHFVYGLSYARGYFHRHFKSELRS